MSTYTAKIAWTKQDEEIFTDNQYSRGHQWQFDGGQTIPASSSPHIVPLPFSVEENIDPEEAFIASLSSCHMLFFLSIAAKRKYVVESYMDNAVGIIDKNESGDLAMTEVRLHPKVIFLGDKKPTLAQLEKLHHQAHERCFIANSVKTNIFVDVDLSD